MVYPNKVCNLPAPTDHDDGGGAGDELGDVQCIPRQPHQQHHHHHRHLHHSRYVVDPQNKQMENDSSELNQLARPFRPHFMEILRKVGFEFSSDCKVGKGRYSKVVQGLYRNAGKKFAIKVIDLERITPEFRHRFLPREINCWKALNHQNICYLYREFQKHNYQFAIMELSDQGDMLAYVQRNGPVPELMGCRLMAQTITAIGYMHYHRIAHRDLKMENLLLFKDARDGFSIKITDFGFCKQGTDLSRTHCGSKSYSAPEILSGSTYDMFKADVWSLGVVGFVMLTNTMPFREDVAHNSIIVEAQRGRRYHYSPTLRLTAACRHAIDTMMTFDAAHRPTVRQCARMPWMQNQIYHKSGTKL